MTYYTALIIWNQNYFRTQETDEDHLLDWCARMFTKLANEGFDRATCTIQLETCTTRRKHGNEVADR